MPRSDNDAAAFVLDTRFRERRDVLRTSEKGIVNMFSKLGWLTAGIGIVALACVAFVPSAGVSASTPTTGATPAPAPGTATTANIDIDRWPLRIQGRPESLDGGGANGWYVWHDDTGLHIRTTTPAARDHVFTAVLTTAGVFRDVDKVRLENKDDVQLLDGGHVLIVRFHTYAGIDGADFRIAGGDGLHLRFDEAGNLVPASHIFLGHFSVHPGDNPFSVRRKEA
jgi:hypothetical protein